MNIVCDGKQKDFVFKNPGPVEKIYYLYGGVEYFFCVGKDGVLSGQHVKIGTIPLNGQKARVVLRVCPDKDTHLFTKTIISSDDQEIKIIESFTKQENNDKDTHLFTKTIISSDDQETKIKSFTKQENNEKKMESYMNQRSFVTHAEKAFDEFNKECVFPISEKLEAESKRYSEHYKGLSESIIILKEKQNATARYIEENVEKGSIAECKKQIGEMKKNNDEFIKKLTEDILARVEERIAFTDDLIEKFIMMSAKIEAKFKQGK